MREGLDAADGLDAPGSPSRRRFHDFYTFEAYQKRSTSFAYEGAARPSRGMARELGAAAGLEFLAAVHNIPAGSRRQGC